MLAHQNNTGDVGADVVVFVIGLLLYNYGAGFAIITIIAVILYIGFSMVTTDWRTEFVREAAQADSKASTLRKTRCSFSFRPQPELRVGLVVAAGGQHEDGGVRLGVDHALVQLQRLAPLFARQQLTKRALARHVREEGKRTS